MQSEATCSGLKNDVHYCKYLYFLKSFKGLCYLTVILVDPPFYKMAASKMENVKCFIKFDHQEKT